MAVLSNIVVGRRLDNVPLSSDTPVVTRTDKIDDLFSEHYSALTRLIYRIVGNAAWAEELAAEAFWKLHHNPPRTNQNLAGWLYRAGLRLALDNMRKRKRRAHYENLAPPPNAMQGPAEALEVSERKTRVRRVLAVLKPEQASLLVLRSEGYSLAEMAALLHSHPNSVGTFIARADAAFRKEYVSLYGTE